MLFSAGSNARGQLGHGSTDDSHVFARCVVDNMPAAHRILDLVCGANHTLMLVEIFDDTGVPVKEVWGCGDGTAGQFGPRHKEEFYTFRRLDIPHQQDGFVPKLVAATWQSSFIVLECDGKSDVIVSMGSNDFGDLAGSPFGHKIPGMETVTFNGLYMEDQTLSGVFTVHTIVAGQHHVVVSVSTPNTTQRYLVGWGAARHGQLRERYGEQVAIEQYPKVLWFHGEAQSFALGAQHTAILLTTGQPLVYGSNRKGQMDGVRYLTGAQKVGCTWNGTYVVTNEGVVSKGLNSNGQLGRDDDSELSMVEFPFPKRAVKKLACGSEHVVTLFEDGEVWGWGWNEHGNLGLGRTEDVPRPTKIWSENMKCVNVWAGPGTTWLYVQQ